MNFEGLYAYALLLRTGIISIQHYSRWLDDVFLKTNEEDEMLIEFEFCSNDINKTISLINSFINPHLKKLDYSLVGRMLFKALEDKYFQEFCDLEDLAHKAYAIWNMLPDDIGKEEPFFTLCYIDDPLSYGDEGQTRKLFKKLFDYY